MKKILSIYMATDNDVYEVIMGLDITIRLDSSGYWEVLEGSDVISDNSFSEADALDFALSHATDSQMLKTKGFGINSGRKFHQLPLLVQTAVLRMAGF